MMRQLIEAAAVEPFQPHEIVDWRGFPDTLQRDAGELGSVAQLLVRAVRPRVDAAGGSLADPDRARAGIAAQLNEIVEQKLLFKTELPDGAQQELTRLVDRLGGGDEAERRASIHVLTRTFAPHLSISPYPGPSPFRESDAFRFFGRESKATEVVSRVISNRVVLVHSPSGAGKTSLLNTLVVPQLQEAQCRVLPPTRFRGPKLPRHIRNPFVFQALSAWDADAEAHPNQKLTEFLGRRFADSDSFQPVVAVFDQFEELFTFYSESWRMREDLFAQFRDALRDHRSLRILLLIREDFTARLSRYANLLPDRLGIRIELDRLGQDAALAAICGPLVRTKRRFAAGVAESLVQELMRIDDVDADDEERVAEFVEPVQLQVVCQRLWDELERRERSGEENLEITREHLGGRQNLLVALAEYYEQCLAASVRGTDVSEGRLRTWFENFLITPSHTKGVVLQEGDLVGDLPLEVAKALEAGYLLRSEPRGGHRLFELSHDRFVSAILDSNARFRQRLAREAGQKYQRLLDKSADWHARGKLDRFTFDDRELRDAHHFLGVLESAGIEPEEHFALLVERSDAAESRRKERRKRLGMYVAAAFIVCLTALSYNMLLAWRLANRTVGELLIDSGDDRVARFGELPQAQLLFNKVAEGASLGATKTALEIRRSLVWSQLPRPVDVFAFDGQTSAQLRDDGRVLLTGERQGLFARELDEQGRAQAYEQGVRLDSHLGGELQSVSWQPGGSRFLCVHLLSSDRSSGRPASQAIGGERYVLSLGDSEAAGPIVQIATLPGKPVRTGLSQDGAWCYAVVKLAADHREQVLLISVAENTTHLFDAGEAAVDVVQFLGDAEPRATSRLLVGCRDGVTVIWDGVDKVDLTTLGGDGDPNQPAGADSADTPEAPGNAGRPTGLSTNQASSGRVDPAKSAAVSPDGSLLVCGHQGHLRLWFHRDIWASRRSSDRNRPFHRPVILDVGVDRPVSAIVLSPDGRRLGAMVDQAAFVWELEQAISPDTSRRAPLTELPHGATLYGLALGPSHSLAATAGRDRTVKIWRLAEGTSRLACAPLFHPGTASQVKWLPDGVTVFTESGGNGQGPRFAAIWRLPKVAYAPCEFTTGRPLGRPVLQGSTQWLSSISPDGAAQLTDYQDGTLLGEQRLSDGATFLHVSRTREHVLVGDGGERVAIYDVRSAAPTLAAGVSASSVQYGIVDSRHQTAVLFSSHGSTLVTRLYDWSSGKFVPLGDPIERDERLLHATYSPSGEQLLWTAVEPSDDEGRLRVLRLKFPPAGKTPPTIDQLEARNTEAILYADFNAASNEIIATSKSDQAVVYDMSRLPNAPAVADEAPPMPEPLAILRHTADVSFALLVTLNIGGREREVAVTCSDDNSARVWNVATGEPMTNELMHEGYVTHASVDVERQLLVTASLDGAARIWSLATGEYVGLLNAGEPIHAVGVCGDQVATLSSPTPPTWHSLQEVDNLPVAPARLRYWQIGGVETSGLSPRLETEYLELLACRVPQGEGTDLLRMESADMGGRWRRLRAVLPDPTRPPQAAGVDQVAGYEVLREQLAKQEDARRAVEVAMQRSHLELQDAQQLREQNKKLTELITGLRRQVSEFERNSGSQARQEPWTRSRSPSLAPRK